MFNQKNENINSQYMNPKNQEELMDDENVIIHTMQDDINALSGIFPAEKKIEAPLNFKKTEDNNKAKEGIKTEQYFNPFLDKQIPPAQEKIADFVNKNNNVPENIPVKDAIIPDNKPGGVKVSGSSSSSKKVMWIIIILVLLVASFAGGYYFWINKKEVAPVADNKEEVPKQEEVKTEEPKSENIESIPKYSSDKQNYLTIDTENPSYESLKNILIQTASEIKSLEVKEPVKFVITDKNRSPISFPMFKVISNLKLSDNLMKNLSDEFSLFMFHSAGSVRIGLSVSVLDQAKASTLMKTEEPKLVEELNPLFLENVVPPKEKVIFKDSNYKGVDIRYFNLITDHQTAIDYAFTKDHLIIGTSKNTAWAIIDQVLDGTK